MIFDYPSCQSIAEMIHGVMSAKFRASLKSIEIDYFGEQMTSRDWVCLIDKILGNLTSILHFSRRINPILFCPDQVTSEVGGAAQQNTYPVEHHNAHIFTNPENAWELILDM